MQEFLLQTYTIILPIALGYIVWLLQQQKKDKNANERGTMLLLRVQLIKYHEEYIRMGEIPPDAYQTFEEMYEAYRDLNGNGMAKKLYEEIKELHIKSGGGK
nr:MAG TPA: holin protein [Bacteriophage sp.]